MDLSKFKTANIREIAKAFYNTLKLEYLDISGFNPEDLANYTDAFKNINNGNNMTIVVKNQTEWKTFTNIFPDYVTIKEPEPKFSSE